VFVEIFAALQDASCRSYAQRLTGTAVAGAPGGDGHQVLENKRKIQH
jgi:hypothetical protein